MSEGAEEDRSGGGSGGPDAVGAPLDGMLDAVDWPRRIKARVVEPGEEPRLHGYAAESDLARHYSFSEVVYLALAGELPSEAVARAFDVALAYLAPVAINEGAAHAASLTRLGQAPPRAVLEVTAVALAERGHSMVEGLREFLAWLDTAHGAPPTQFVTDDPAQARSLRRLREALPASLDVPALRHPLTRSAAIVAVLHACSLGRPEQLEAVWTLASMAPVFAEAMATKPLTFREYPMDTPGFRYRETR